MKKIFFSASSRSKNAKKLRQIFPAKMEKTILSIFIWINLFGAVRPVKPIFDLANNMRLVKDFIFHLKIDYYNGHVTLILRSYQL